MLSQTEYKIQEIKVENMKSNEDILNEIHHAKTHSKSARKIYRNAVKQYTQQQESSLYELIQEADHEEEKGTRWRDRQLKTRLLEYRQHLINTYKKNTVQAYFNAIKSIYNYYEIEIGTLPSINKRQLNIPEPINYDDLPTHEIIRKALDIADLRMKAIILFMSSSGCAKRETLNLTIQSFIEATSDYHNSNNIYDVLKELEKRDDVIPTFRLRRQKTNKYYYTFCSPEAVQAIITYINTFEKPIHPNDKLFPIHEDYITLLFIQMNNQLGLGKKGTFNRLRSHNLRKFHASQLYNDGMSLDEIDALQGRRKDTTHTAYFMENPSKLKEKYIEHLDCLTINLDVNSLNLKSEEYLQLEKENKELKDDLNTILDRIEKLEKIL